MSSAATLFFLRRGHRSGPDFDARRQHSGFDVAPQCDQQLPRQGDDGDPARAPLQGANALAEPSRERAARLVAQPQPGTVERRASGPRHLRVERAVGVAQDVLLHLAHGVARQVVDEDHPLRQLELGKPRLERGRASSFSVERGVAGSVTTTAVTPSPKSGCGTPMTALSTTPGDRVDLALDLLRIDVVAAGDDEVLAAPDDVDVAAARRSCRGRR